MISTKSTSFHSNTSEREGKRRLPVAHMRIKISPKVCDNVLCESAWKCATNSNQTVSFHWNLSAIGSEIEDIPWIYFFHQFFTHNCVNHKNCVRCQITRWVIEKILVTKNHIYDQMRDVWLIMQWWEERPSFMQTIHKFRELPRKRVFKKIKIK